MKDTLIGLREELTHGSSTELVWGMMSIYRNMIWKKLDTIWLRGYFGLQESLCNVDTAQMSIWGYGTRCLFGGMVPSLRSRIDSLCLERPTPSQRHYAWNVKGLPLARASERFPLTRVNVERQTGRMASNRDTLLSTLIYTSTACIIHRSTKRDSSIWLPITLVVEGRQWQGTSAWGTCVDVFC